LEERLSKDETDKLKAILGSTVSTKDVAYVRQLMNTYNILGELYKKITTLSSEAKSSILKLSIEPDYKKLFNELVEYNATRGT